MITGLSEEEAAARRARGEGNDYEVGTSRAYLDIIRANLFSFFNNLLFVIGAALIALGRLNDAMTSVGLGLVNALISTGQEIYAKRQLDRIALLHRPTATLVRAGVERTADPTEIVKGDIIRLRSGDQVVVDGPVEGDSAVEINEALLTGESSPIRKQPGDQLLSGSFCVSGDAYYRAEKVGRDSYANQLTASARQFRLTKTPLQRQIDFSVRVIMLVVALMSGVILLAALLENATTLRVVQLAAVLSGQVPYGLFFVIIVAYAMGAAAIARRGALVQQINAVESLSDVDVLCTDKTGTLTANRLALHALVPAAAVGAERFARLLGRFARSAGDETPTIVAIRGATPGESAAVAGEVHFSSARKWSALSFAGDDEPGAYVLGAFDALLPALAAGAGRAELSRLADNVAALASRGARVLLLARNADADALRQAGGEPALPPLEPLGLVALVDELRPLAAQTLATFSRLGIRLKIISGDDARTVVAVARQAGMEGDLPSVTGAELDALSPEAFEQAAEDATILGRISPAQKERLIAALVHRGHHVSMIGDGVNDVLALKKAQLGIAMQSGSPAARAIADIVLVGDSFAALVPAFREGQRIVSGMTTVMALFLARVSASILMIVAITMLGLSFPFEPAQIATSLFTVGIPALLLAMWAKPATPVGDLLPRLVRFVIPTAILTMIVGVALYTLQYDRVLNTVTAVDIPQRVIDMFERVTGVDYSAGDKFAGAAATIVAQTVLSTFVAYTAFVLILFVEPPFRFFTGWRDVSDDRRPAYLAVALSVIFFVIVQTGPIAAYFALIPLGPGMLLQVAGGLIVWTLALRETWRRGWLDRFLDLGP
ncbi:MAG: HAD-IC family P-type ATPase [Bauldia sp.]|nr:HAD-IC family P-type ATPase [Bauldia sp.]